MDIDRFGASDAWAIFTLWAFASGHNVAGATGLLVTIAIIILPDER